MGQFLRLAKDIDVLPVLLDLSRAPHLWDQYRTRTTYENTPHAASSDIWVRFRSPNEIVGLESHREEYRCVYWPAWRELPSLRPLVRALKNTVDAVELGSILITRLAPGKAILPAQRQRVMGCGILQYQTACHLGGAVIKRMRRRQCCHVQW